MGQGADNTETRRKEGAAYAGRAEKARLRLGFAGSLVTAVPAAVGLHITFSQSGPSMLAYYTIDSGLFLLFACCAAALFYLRAIRTGAALPAWVMTAKYIAACCESVTFLVVLGALAPQQGGSGYAYLLFRGYFLCLHFLCPLLAVGTLLLFDRVSGRPLRLALTALLPTALYALIFLLLNILRVYEGPYFFFMVYSQPLLSTVLWAAAILSGAFVSAFLLAWLKQRKQR